MCVSDGTLSAHDRTTARLTRVCSLSLAIQTCCIASSTTGASWIRHSPTDGMNVASLVLRVAGKWSDRRFVRYKLRCRGSRGELSS